MRIYEMGARSEAWNKYLVVVDRANKFMFANPLPNKTAENVARKLLELLLTFGIPLADSALPQRLRPCETDPLSMDRTVGCHSSDNTRTVLPRHPSGEKLLTSSPIT